jgi:hypothetical protein
MSCGKSSAKSKDRKSQDPFIAAPSLQSLLLGLEEGRIAVQKFTPGHPARN